MGESKMADTEGRVVNCAMTKVRRSDDLKKIIYGVVYSPNELDTWGEMMLADDVELMAHRFMQLAMRDTIDTAHDEKATRTCYPVESYIARKNDPDGYPEGSWVLGVQLDDEHWQKYKKGEINGYSFQCLVTKVPAVVEIVFDPEIFGVTEPAEDGHTHTFFAVMNEDGVVVSGRTSTDNGHSHAVKRGTATEETNGHRHRYLLE